MTAGWYPDPDDGSLLRYWDGAAWTDHRTPAQQPAASPYPAQDAALHGPQPMGDIYRTPSLERLTASQRQQFSQHTLTSFPVWAVIVLHFLTFGLFTLIYQGLNLSKLPRVKHDDFGAGKGIGFNFIPIYSFYWVFRFVHALVDRLNFQIRLRGRRPRISRDFATVTCSAFVVPYIGLLACVFLVPIVAGQIQSTVNELAAEREAYLAQLPPAPLPPVAGTQAFPSAPPSV